MSKQQVRSALIVGSYEHETRLVKEAFDRNLSTLSVLTHSFEAALERLEHESFFLIWLSMPIGAIENREMVQTLRAHHKQWLVWSALNIEAHEELAAIKSGVDFCFKIPGWRDLALARICAFVGRVETATEENQPTLTPLTVMRSREVFRNGDLQIGDSKRKVKIGERHVSLSGADFELLCVFLQYKGELLTRDFLYRRLVGYEWNGIDRTIDQRIVRLRKKLGDTASNPRWIRSIRGVGYRMTSYH